MMLGKMIFAAIWVFTSLIAGFLKSPEYAVISGVAYAIFLGLD